MPSNKLVIMFFGLSVLACKPEDGQERSATQLLSQSAVRSVNVKVLAPDNQADRQVYTPQAADNNSATQFVKHSELELRANEGLVYFKGQVFSGTATAYYSSGVPEQTSEFLHGKKHGKVLKFFADGMLSYSAEYTRGRLHGQVKTWWIHGKQRSQANYINGVVDGLQRQWYRSGAKFKELFFKQGVEHGMQRAWRENGKLYNNYEAVNGRIFGLKRASLCYELENETIQYQEF